jgi:WD40 repeat protein
MLIGLGYCALPNWGQLKSTELLLQSADHPSGTGGIDNNLAISPDGNLLVANGVMDPLQLYRKSDGQSLNIFKDRGKAALVTAVAFAPDNKTIAGPLFDYQRSHPIILWDTQSGNEKQRLIGHNASVMAVTFSSDGKLLASGSMDKTVKIWNIEAGKLEKTFQTSHYVERVSFSIDSTIIRSADQAGTVQQWQIKTGKLLQTLDNPQNTVDPQSASYTVDFSADGKLMARADNDHAIRLWSLETGKLVSTLRGHHGFGSGISFSPSGLLLASIGGSGARDLATGGKLDDLSVWNVQTGQLVAESDKYQNLGGVVFDPHLNIVVTGGRGGRVNLWKIDAAAQDRSGSSTPLK